MKPEKLILTNFRSFADTHELDFTELHQAVVTGRNGVGKSSLFIDSILYALKGTSRKRAENLISRGYDSMSVTFVFSHNGQRYKIIREQKGSKQSLEFWCGETDLSERLLTPTQKKLDETINISYDLLLSTTVAQQDEINKLSQMGPSDRETILNEMLGYTKWEKKKDKINKILNDYKNVDKDIEITKKAVEANDLQIAELNAQISAGEERANFFKDLKEKYEKQVELLESDFINYQKFTKLEGDYNQLSWLRDNIQTNINEIENLDASTIKESLGATVRELEDNLETLNQIDEQISELQKNLLKVNETINQVSVYKKLQPQTEVLKDVPCVGMDIHDKCKLLSSALTTKKSIDAFMIQSKITSLDEFWDVLGTERKELNEKVTFYNTSRGTIIKENSVLEKTIHKSEEQLKEANRKAVLQTELEIKKDQISKLEEELKLKPNFNNTEYMSAKDNFGKTNNEYNSYQVSLAKQETALKMTTESNNKLQIELNKYNETQGKLANYRILQQAYNDIPTLLFEQAIPTIESYTNEILSRIFPTEQIQLRSFKETKSNTLQKALDIVSLDGMDSEDKSGSEQVRQSLALRIALARYNSEQNGVHMPFFIVDEGGFGSLDDENKDMLKLMLREVAQRFDLFLVITHLTELKDVFDTQIVVNPTGKGDKIQIL